MSRNADRWTRWIRKRYKESKTPLPKCDLDHSIPLISDMVALSDGRLVVLDVANNKVKLVSAYDEYPVTTIKFAASPERIALLSDGRVAVTKSDQSIDFLDVQTYLLLKSTVRTEKHYNYGIVAGPDDMLIVCGKNDQDPGAFVDMIHYDGKLFKTIVAGDSAQLTLKKPGFMCVMGNHLLVPDSIADCVYKVEISSGRLVDTISHDSIYGPTQVLTDNTGSLFTHFMKYDRWLECSALGEWKPYVLTRNVDRLKIIRKICLTHSGFVLLFVDKPDYFSSCMIMRYEVPVVP